MKSSVAISDAIEPRHASADHNATRPSMEPAHCARSLTVSVFAAAVLLLSCGRTVEVLLDCPSPDGTANATFYRVHGGGAAGWAFFRVSVRGSAEALRPDTYQFAMRHGYDVRLTWRSPSALLIEYPDQAAVDLQQEQVKSVGDARRLIQLEYGQTATVPVNSIPGGRKCLKL